MARVVMSTYMVRYPMGGMLSWALEYALGVRRLGHDLYLVERATSSDACWDPTRGVMTNDPSFGWATTHRPVAAIRST